MSLYLDYRPKTFHDLVGQHHIIDILQAQVKNKQLATSYLLFGPRWTGKTSTARLLAKVANCTTFMADGSPDLLNDPIAKLIDENKTLDFIEIDAASHTGVDNIREEIIDKALYPPVHLQKKVYVIDEVHMLSKGAFNALLKIMEEPPSYLMFVLATTEMHKVPDTIISRCQVFNFKQLTIDEIAGRLEKITTKEQITADPEALRLIAKLSGGALRDGIKYLEQVSILGDVTEKNVAQFLWVVSGAMLDQAMLLLLGDDPVVWMHFLDELITKGIDLTNLVKEILLRLDEHFLEKPSLYAPMAEMFREISSEAKRYPHPVLLRKSKTRKWFEEQGKTDKAEITNNEQNTLDSRQVAEQHTASATASKEQDDPVSVIAATPTPVANSDDSSENTQPAQTSTPLESSPEQLMEQLFAITTNPMIKSALKQYTMIDEISDGVISVVVINEQFYHTLSKAETSHDLEKKLSEQLGKKIQLRRVNMTKEQRLAKQLG